jgi:hypothetical protein
VPGVLGALISRAAPQVLRLSVLYALLDVSPEVREPHLRAALALWGYAERSCRWIFGETTGDRDADEVLSALRANPDGLTRTEVSALFNRNKSAVQLDKILGLLVEQGLVIPGKPAAGGKPAGKWQVAPAGTNPTNAANAVATQGLVATVAQPQVVSGQQHSQHSLDSYPPEDGAGEDDGPEIEVPW